jgi:hypothetical protein
MVQNAASKESRQTFANQKRVPYMMRHEKAPPSRVRGDGKAYGEYVITFQKACWPPDYHLRFIKRTKRMRRTGSEREREFLVDKLLVRIHPIIKMIWWTVLAP